MEKEKEITTEFSAEHLICIGLCSLFIFMQYLIIDSAIQFAIASGITLISTVACLYSLDTKQIEEYNKRNIRK